MRRSRRVALLLALAAAAGGAGCKTINSFTTKAPEPGRNEGEWAAVRNVSTRRAVIYDRFQQRAIATATYLSPPVREARTRRLGEWLGWTEHELTDHLAAEAAEAAKYDDFLVALFTPDRKSNDLDSRSSVWRLAVRLDDGNEVVTRDATALDADATVRTLFPYVSPFDTIYRIRFNRAPGGPLSDRRFTLEIVSALGKMALTYGDGAIGPERPEGSLIQ
jgi:hypothetical protein